MSWYQSCAIHDCSISLRLRFPSLFFLWNLSIVANYISNVNYTDISKFKLKHVIKLQPREQNTRHICIRARFKTEGGIGSTTKASSWSTPSLANQSAHWFLSLSGSAEEILSTLCLKASWSSKSHYCTNETAECCSAQVNSCLGVRIAYDVSEAMITAKLQTS